MTKKEEREREDSTWNRVPDDEPVFILRGKDKAAYKAVLYWMEWRLRLGLNKNEDRKIDEAQLQLDRMYLHAYRNEEGTPAYERVKEQAERLRIRLEEEGRNRGNVRL